MLSVVYDNFFSFNRFVITRKRAYKGKDLMKKKQNLQAKQTPYFDKT
jgi:hypothetical protein